MAFNWPQTLQFGWIKKRCDFGIKLKWIMWSMCNFANIMGLWGRSRRNGTKPWKQMTNHTIFEFGHEKRRAGSELELWNSNSNQIHKKNLKTSELRNQKLKTLWGSFSKLQTVDAEQLPAPIVTHESQTDVFRSLHFCYTRRHDSTRRRVKAMFV